MWSAHAAARRLLAAETGTVVKDWGGRLPVALIYPNTYHVGMSSLGFLTMYRVFNGVPDVVCERAFAGELSARGSGAGPISIESQRPLSEFSVLAFSLTFELDYFNVLGVLRASGVPLLAAERSQGDPVVIGGGPAVTGNPEVMGPFFDALVIGEGEPVAEALLDVLKDGAGGDRDDLRNRLAAIPGLYVPTTLTPVYDEQGMLSRLQPAGSRGRVQTQWVRDLDSWPAGASILTRATEFGDSFLMEITRGCGRGCRFCMVSHIARPVRRRSVSVLLREAAEAASHRDRVGLVGAAVSDFREIDALVAGLRQLNLKVAVSALRMDPLPESLLQALLESGTRTLTLAPETGSERLRQLINKRLLDDEILGTAERLAQRGLPKLKLYFMFGVPTETDDDITSIVTLCDAIKERFARHRAPTQVEVAMTPYVPKPRTPLQRVGMAPVALLTARARYLQSELRRRSIATKVESVPWTVVQGTLARGDRRLASVLLAMERPGLAAWREALRRTDLSEEFYATRERGPAETLPWSIIA